MAKEGRLPPTTVTYLTNRFFNTNFKRNGKESFKRKYLFFSTPRDINNYYFQQFYIIIAHNIIKFILKEVKFCNI